MAVRALTKTTLDAVNAGIPAPSTIIPAKLLQQSTLSRRSKSFYIVKLTDAQLRHENLAYRTQAPAEACALLAMEGLAPPTRLAKVFNVPRTSIQRAVTALKDQREVGKPGRPTLLNRTLEGELISWLDKQLEKSTNLEPESIAEKVRLTSSPFQTFPHFHIKATALRNGLCRAQQWKNAYSQHIHIELFLGGKKQLQQTQCRRRGEARGRARNRTKRCKRWWKSRLRRLRRRWRERRLLPNSMKQQRTQPSVRVRRRTSSRGGGSSTSRRNTWTGRPCSPIAVSHIRHRSQARQTICARCLVCCLGTRVQHTSSRPPPQHWDRVPVPQWQPHPRF